LEDIKHGFTLYQLGQEESALLTQIDSVEGTMEDKSRQLEENGIYGVYRHIHARYATLASSDFEALKRGLFLQWMSLVDPACFTGLWEFDLEAEWKIIEVLNDKLCNDQADAELRCMVSYYAGWDWIFDLHSGYDSLNHLLANRIDYDLILEELKRSNLIDRGQMGKYWKAFF
jgi:hypothetical protein